MSEKVSSTVWGIAPWSDELLKVSGDIDRGRAGPGDYIQQLKEDRSAYQQALEAADVDYYGGDWGATSDYFRETVLHADGFALDIDTAPVTRWFDTNTFFRRPTIEGPLRHVPAARFLPPDSDIIYQPTLLSPYTFAKLAVRSSNVNEATAQRYVNELYDELFGRVADRGVDYLLLHEPYAPYHQVDKKERAQLKHAIGSLASNHPSVNVGLYFSFGNAAELVGDFAADERVAAIGCDLLKTPIAELPSLPDHRFLAGVVDGANTLLLDDAELTPEISAVAAATNSYEVSVTHSVDLEFVPRDYALRKIEQIGRLARNHVEEIV